MRPGWLAMRAGGTGREAVHRLDQAIVRDRVGRDRVAAGHRFGGDQGIQDRLLGRLDDALEQGADDVVVDRADVDRQARIGGERDSRQPAVAGREAQEYVTARVGAGSAHPGYPEPRSLRKWLALVWQERGGPGGNSGDRGATGPPRV